MGAPHRHPSLDPPDPHPDRVLLAGCAGLRAVRYHPEVSDAPDERVARFLEEVHLARLDRDPALRERAGLESRREGWENRSERRSAVDRSLLERELTRMDEEFEPSRLSPGSRLNRRLFLYAGERARARHEWREHVYLALPGDGPPAWLRARLVDGARIEAERDAERWIADAQAAGPWLGAILEEFHARSEAGLLAPRRVLLEVADECRLLLSGRPFEEGASEASPLWGVFHAGLASMSGLEERRRRDLIASAEQALVEDLGPALETLAAGLEGLVASAPADRGVWALPQGEAWYAHCLQEATSLQLTPVALNRLGLQEVARIHAAMRRLQRQVDHRGSLASFFRLLREDGRFFASNDEEGRAALAALASSTLEEVEARLAEVVRPTPLLPLVVDATARGYHPAGPRGRAAIIGLDALDAQTVPRYLIQPRACRLGTPGRHLRESLLAQRTDLPGFRHTLEIPPWSEGWDLYAAQLVSELGLYRDPYAEFGRLAEELWGACLLVVDTAIHHERWSPAQARRWLATNTPVPEAAAEKAIEHVLLYPGRAASGPVGLLRLRELRADAEKRLGTEFDRIAFHAVVLEEGPVPLGLLEERVEEWISNR